jgi:hypothetical protein
MLLITHRYKILSLRRQSNDRRAQPTLQTRSKLIFTRSARPKSAKLPAASSKTIALPKAYRAPGQPAFYLSKSPQATRTATSHPYQCEIYRAEDGSVRGRCTCAANQFCKHLAECYLAAQALANWCINYCEDCGAEFEGPALVKCFECYTAHPAHQKSPS